MKCTILQAKSRWWRAYLVNQDGAHLIRNGEALFALVDTLTFSLQHVLHRLIKRSKYGR